MELESRFGAVGWIEVFLLVISFGFDCSVIGSMIQIFGAHLERSLYGSEQ